MDFDPNVPAVRHFNKQSHNTFRAHIPRSFPLSPGGLAAYLATKMAAQACGDTSESTELSASQRLFLKPIAKLNVHVTLPEIKVAGVSISNWEVMEKLKSVIAPDQFAVLRVVESTLEAIRFEGEADTKASVSKFVTKLDGKFIKLSGFADPLKVRASEAKLKFPSAHEWNSYFRDAKNVDECNPGERPDTICIKGIPSKWFFEEDSNGKPSEKVLKSVFSKFGKIRCVDIPILDPYRERMTKGENEFQTFYFGSHLHFNAYIQYSQYQGFTSAMNGLKGVKLMHISEEGRAATANIQVDFDKSCHLSGKNIKKRELERQRLIDQDRQEKEIKEKEKEEVHRRREEEKIEAERKEAEKLQKIQEELRRKEERRKAREEKRKKKKEEKRKLKHKYEERQRQFKEEQKKLETQRKVEGKRLFVFLLRKIADVKEKEEVERQKRVRELEMLKHIEEKKRKLEEEERQKEEEERRNREKLEEQEKELRDKLVRNLREMEGRKKELQQELSRKQIVDSAKLSSFVINSSGK